MKRGLILAALGAAVLAASLYVAWVIVGPSRASTPQHGAVEVLTAIRARRAGWCMPSEQTPVAVVDGPRLMDGNWVTVCSTIAGGQQGRECVAMRDATLEVLADQTASAPVPTPLASPQCVSSPASGTPGTATPRPTQTAVPLQAPVAVSDLVALVTGAGFDIAFKWTRGDVAPQTGFFSWRQSGGTRRFDYAPGGAEDPQSGWFSLETGLTGAAPSSRSPTILYCLWFGERAGAVSLTCGGPPPMSLESAVFNALNAQATGKLQDRQIAGRTASCYTLDQGGAEPGIICVDRSSNVPLYLLSASMVDRSIQEIEATSATVPGPELAPPPDLPGDVGIPAAPMHAVGTLNFPPSINWSH